MKKYCMLDSIPHYLQQALFVDIPQAGAVIDREYMISQVNKSWTRLTGWTESEHDAMSLIDLAEMQRDKKSLTEKITGLIELGKEYDRIELIVRQKLGGLRKVLMQFFAVSNNSSGTRTFEYAVIWAYDLGPYEEEVLGSALKRLWAYIVVATGLLWASDFSQLVQILWGFVPGTD